MCPAIKRAIWSIGRDGASTRLSSKFINWKNLHRFVCAWQAWRFKINTDCYYKISFFFRKKTRSLEIWFQSKWQASDMGLCNCNLFTTNSESTFSKGDAKEIKKTILWNVKGFRIYEYVMTEIWFFDGFFSLTWLRYQSRVQVQVDFTECN